MRINNNLMAMNAHRQLGKAQNMTSKHMERLSSGFRINRAGDDAAGLAISEKMRAQIRGLNQASRNSQDAISLIQTAEGALDEAHSILQRMRELAVQAANDTNVEVDRDEIQKEINQLTSEVNRIGNTTEFNTMLLLDGTRSSEALINQGTQIGEFLDNGLGFNVNFDGLAEGSYELDIDTELLTNTGVIQVPYSDAVDYSNITGSNPTFANDAIVVSGDNTNQSDAIYHLQGTGSGGTLTIERVNSIQFTVTISAALSAGSSFSSVDTITLNDDGNLVYNEHGISFTITDLGDGWANGTQIEVDLGSDLGAGGQTIDTDNQWDSMNLHSPSFTAASLGTAGITISSSARTGIYSVSFTAGTGATTANSATFTLNYYSSAGATAEVVDVISWSGSDTINFNDHGLDFTLDVAGSSSGSFTFNVEGTWSLTGELFQLDDDGVRGTAIATGEIISDWDLTATSGLTLDNSNFSGLSFEHVGILDGGTKAFDIVDDEVEDRSLDFQIGANQFQALNLSIQDMRSEAIGISTVGDGIESNDGGQWVKISRTHDNLENADLMRTGQQLIDDEGINPNLVDADAYYIEAFFTDDLEVTDGTQAAGVERGLSMASHTHARAAVTVINDAIERVSSERSKLGAIQNRLESTIKNLDNVAENLQAAESRIRDVDMAAEMMQFTRQNILQQASISMLAQANMAPQSVLQLLG